jgi:hypothetical protein
VLFDDTQPPGSQARGQLVRIEIVNDGSRQADDVRVTLRRWLVQTTPSTPWSDFDVDPLPLPWVNPARADPVFGRPVPAKSSGLIELAVRDGDSVRPATPIPGRLPREWSSPWPFAAFWVEVVVTASNADPEVRHLRFGSGANQSIAVFVGPPADADNVEHMGLVNLTRPH